MCGWSSHFAQSIIVYQYGNSLFRIVFKVSIEGLKGCVAIINTDEFKAEYGNLYVIPKKLNQDIVESFFFLPVTNVSRFTKYDSLHLQL